MADKYLFKAIINVCSTTMTKMERNGEIEEKVDEGVV